MEVALNAAMSQLSNVSNLDFKLLLITKLSPIFKNIFFTMSELFSSGDFPRLDGLPKLFTHVRYFSLNVKKTVAISKNFHKKRPYNFIKLRLEKRP